MKSSVTILLNWLTISYTWTIANAVLTDNQLLAAPQLIATTSRPVFIYKPANEVKATEQLFDNDDDVHSVTVIENHVGHEFAVPSEDEIDIYGSFNGVQPLHYDVELKLPTTNESQNSAPYGNVHGTVTIAFKVIYWTQRIFLHARDINFASATVNLVTRNTDGIQKIRVTGASEIPEGMLIVSTDTVLEKDTLYELTIHDFVSRITGAKQMGIFAGLAYAEATSRIYTYTSQFQTDFARTIFPCLDSPRFKSTFLLSITHPPHYIALSGAEQVGTSEPAPNGWRKTRFRSTPPLPTYTLGLVLLPSQGYNLKAETTDAIELNLWYNKLATSTGLADTLFGYIKHSWSRMSTIFKNVPLPLTKIDYVTIPDFKVQGMENWALITLNEQYLHRQTPAYRLSLIAHETTHQWISNLVTVSNWQYLCLQEGITDYYARRTVKEYLGENNEHYQLYMIDKYVSAMQLETNHMPPADLVISRNPTLGEVSNRCFGKGVFLVQALADSIRNLTAFDEIVTSFVDTNKMGHFELSEFSRHFMNRAVFIDRRQNTNEPTLMAGEYFARWFGTPGYPSVLVKRSYVNSTVWIEQLGIFPKAGSYASTNYVWPIPMHFRKQSDNFDHQGTDMNSAQIILDSPSATFTLPNRLNVHSWLLVNNEFGQFYRVNYDLHNWMLLAQALLDNPSQFILLDRVRLAHDFCFFNTLGLVQNGDSVRQKLKRAVHLRPTMFPAAHAYMTTCQPSHNST